MKKSFQLLLYFLFLSIPLFSQSTITSIVLDTDNNFIKDINISILNPIDSSLISTTKTDTNGIFTVKDTSLIFPISLIIKLKKGNIFNSSIYRIFNDSTQQKIVIKRNIIRYKINKEFERTNSKLIAYNNDILKYKVYIDSFNYNFGQKSTYPENKALKEELSIVIGLYDNTLDSLNQLKDSLQNTFLNIKTTQQALKNFNKNISIISRHSKSIILKPAPTSISYIKIDTCKCVKTDKKSYLNLEIQFHNGKNKQQQKIKIGLFKKNTKTQNETLVQLKQNDGFYDFIIKDVIVGLYKLNIRLNTKNTFQKHTGPYIIYLFYGDRFGKTHIYTLEDLNKCK